MRRSLAPWCRDGFHPASEICFSSKQNLTMSCAGKETRCFSSQYPKNTWLCQQEKQERKCPPEHYYVKASVVLSCPTKGFTVDRQRYNLQVKFSHPACTAVHWAPTWDVACVLQPLCSCSPPLLLNFFSKPSSTTTAESLQPPWGSALSSMWGSTQSQRMPGCFCQWWEPIGTAQEAFHGVREQPSVTSVWVIWGGKLFTHCVHSSHCSEWLWAVWLMRVGMCYYLDKRSSLDCRTGYWAHIFREKGQP